MELEVEFEPEIEQSDGTILTPDFRLSTGNTSLLVEAFVVNDPEDEMLENAAQESLQEEINSRVKATGVLVAVQVLQQAAAQELQISQVADKVESWIQTLNFERIKARENYEPLVGQSEFFYDRNGWKIHFSAMQVDQGGQSRQLERLVGIRTFGFQRDSTKDSHDIRDRIRKKAKKYRVIDIPMIPAILVERIGAGDVDIKSALFGNVAVTGDLLRTGKIDGTWLDDVDGLWATRQGPRHQSIPSVIALSRHFEPALVAELEPTVWLNPWSEHDLHGVFRWQCLRANAREGGFSKVPSSVAERLYRPFEAI